MRTGEHLPRSPRHSINPCAARSCKSCNPCAARCFNSSTEPGFAILHHRFPGRSVVCSGLESERRGSVNVIKPRSRAGDTVRPLRTEHRACKSPAGSQCGRFSWGSGTRCLSLSRRGVDYNLSGPPPAFGPPLAERRRPESRGGRDGPAGGRWI